MIKDTKYKQSVLQQINIRYILTVWWKDSIKKDTAFRRREDLDVDGERMWQKILSKLEKISCEQSLVEVKDK